MVQVVVVVREPGKLKPDYSLHFDLPEVPAVGSYISIRRPDQKEPWGEDMIVRQVWWRLFHPITAGITSGSEAERPGTLTEIMVECDPAVGPYSSDDWLKWNQGKLGVEEFKLARLSIRESDLEG